jgi:hypothetical protein
MQSILLLLLLTLTSINAIIKSISKDYQRGEHSLSLSKQLSILSKPDKYVDDYNNNTNITVDPTRWAIVALTRPSDININTRNANLKNYLRRYHHYHNITLIFFSEFKIKNRTKDLWGKIFKNVATIRIINTYKDGFDEEDRYGYKYVCKFFSISMFKYLENDYDYYMRLDGDVYIKKLDYDIFAWTALTQPDYVFGARKIEAHRTTRETLPSFVANYTKKYNIVPTCNMDEPLSFCFNFYNNFHIGKVSFMTSNQVKHFLNEILDSNNIVQYRWGDSTIQAYTVRLFSKPERIFQVQNFTYIHGSHGLVLVSNGHGIESTVPNALPDWKMNYTVSIDVVSHKEQDNYNYYDKLKFFIVVFFVFFFTFLFILRND